MSTDSQCSSVAKPSQVILATNLLWASFAIWLLGFALNYLLTYPEYLRSVSLGTLILLLALIALFFAFFAVLIYKTSNGHNWARILLLLVVALNILDIQFLMTLFGRQVMVGSLLGISLLLNIFALYLLFIGPGAAWFKMGHPQ